MGPTGAGCLAPKRQTNISIVLTQLRLSGQAIASALLALDRSGTPLHLDGPVPAAYSGARAVRCAIVVYCLRLRVAMLAVPEGT